MIAYKGFHPGMVCIGYQFQMGLNVTKEANCRQNGFHCAEAVSYTHLTLPTNSLV